MLAGWHSSALQIDSNVENLIAFAFPDFKIEIFAVVIPIISASSLLFIFLLAKHNVKVYYYCHRLNS